MRNKREIGFEYEEMAKDFLVSRKLEFIEKNFYSKYGEIDLIMLDRENEILVFVEVKYRKNINYGNPVEVIDFKKIERIRNTSKIYLDKIKWKNSIRYDVIGITQNKIEWIENAF